MEQTAQTKKKVWIPEVPKERILELAKRIKPVARFVEGELGFFQDFRGFLYYIEPRDPWDDAFLSWNPKPARRAKGLKPLCVITTHHHSCSAELFEPSVAEVLAQIPEEHLDNVVAFEIVKCPESRYDLAANPEALNAGYHVAITQLFVRK